MATVTCLKGQLRLRNYQESSNPTVNGKGISGPATSVHGKKLCDSTSFDCCSSCPNSGRSVYGQLFPWFGISYSAWMDQWYSWQPDLASRFLALRFCSRYRSELSCSHAYVHRLLLLVAYISNAMGMFLLFPWFALRHLPPKSVLLRIIESPIQYFTYVQKTCASRFIAESHWLTLTVNLK